MSNISKFSTAKANEFLRNTSRKLGQVAPTIGSIFLLILNTELPLLAKPGTSSQFKKFDPFSAATTNPNTASSPTAAPVTMGRVCPMFKIEDKNLRSHGKIIRTQIYLPESNRQKSPVVLIFHGAGGLGGESDKGFFQETAYDLALHGKMAIIVHYMDQSGLKSASREQMGKNFSKWISTVKNAIEYAKTIPGADPNNINLLGHSLGAQLALYAAANRTDVKSVTVMAGCFVLPTTSVKTMPPVLILQGTADKTVTLARERKLVQTLKGVNCKYEEHLLKNVDHSFSQIEYNKLIELIDKFLSKN